MVKPFFCQKKFLILAAFLAIADGSGQGCYAAAQAQEQNGALHGNPWAFGQSTDREAVLWQKGVDGATISKKGWPPSKTGGKNGVDSRTGIDTAIANTKSQGAKSKFGVTLQKESNTWAVAPEVKAMRPDEEKTRVSQHVLRAYAGVEAADDFNISVGPELILKDEERSAEAANPNQPESTLGLGMKFQFDF